MAGGGTSPDSGQGTRSPGEKPQPRGPTWTPGLTPNPGCWLHRPQSPSLGGLFQAGVPLASSHSHTCPGGPAPETGYLEGFRPPLG